MGDVKEIENGGRVNHLGMPDNHVASLRLKFGGFISARNVFAIIERTNSGSK
jgi:hypothetical protein